MLQLQWDSQEEVARLIRQDSQERKGVVCVHEAGLLYLLNCHLGYSGRQKYMLEKKKHDCTKSLSAEGMQ